VSIGVTIGGGIRAAVATPDPVETSTSGEVNDTAESGRAGGDDASSIGEDASGIGLGFSRGRYGRIMSGFVKTGDGGVSWVKRS